MPAGREIHLFLIDGSPNGAVQATVPTWDGIVFSIPHDAQVVRRILGYDECKKAGVYVLVGANLDNAEESWTYVGQSDNLSTRAPSHLDKEWWDRIYLILCSQEWFTADNARYLEHRFYDLGSKAGRTRLQNIQNPGTPTLGKAQISTTENFLEIARMVLGVLLKEDIFRPAEEMVKHAVDQSSVDSESADGKRDIPLFFLQHEDVDAKARLVNGQWIVLKGSLARRRTLRSFKKLQLRTEMLQQGILVEDSSHPASLRLTKDYVFSSPSGACSIMIGSSAKGPIQWRIYEEKIPYNKSKTFKEWEKEQLKKK